MCSPNGGNEPGGLLGADAPVIGALAADRLGTALGLPVSTPTSSDLEALKERLARLRLLLDSFSRPVRVPGRDQECPLNTLSRRWLHDAGHKTEIYRPTDRSGR